MTRDHYNTVINLLNSDIIDDITLGIGLVKNNPDIQEYVKNHMCLLSSGWGVTYVGSLQLRKHIMTPGKRLISFWLKLGESNYDSKSIWLR